jgi:hypothetical protein
MVGPRSDSRDASLECAKPLIAHLPPEVTEWISREKPLLSLWQALRLLPARPQALDKEVPHSLWASGVHSSKRISRRSEAHYLSKIVAILFSNGVVKGGREDSGSEIDGCMDNMGKVQR